MNILFLGGSFTADGRLPEIFKKQYEIKYGEVCNVASRTFRQAKLCEHFISKESRELLNFRNWDVVVLQEQSKLPIDNPEEALKSIMTWKEAIPRNTLLILMMTWRRREDSADCDRWAKHLDFFKKVHSAGVFVSPVGLAWEIYKGVFPRQELMEENSSHSSPKGAELSAICLIESLSASASASASEVRSDKWKSQPSGMQLSAVAAHKLFMECENVIN
ncbi:MULTISPECIES: hypothetical protein [Citrobacter]|uniref:hypothetical protein n=1 Tax=Citrobacter TaxID=544 RepID=UPI0023B29479|nr:MULTISPECIES: hypothetical protein [Citrobacter]MDE9704554.1 hypothetical protein [Citrobacter portucalensis]MDM2856410.1 hypothetical protein [Citrobacter sp. Cpo071]